MKNIIYKLIKTKRIYNYFSPLISHLSSPAKPAGQMLVELVMAIGLAAIILPALLTGLVTSREGKPQQEQRVQAIQLMKETEAAVKSIRDNGWSTFAINGTFHPVISGTSWALTTGASTSGNFTRQVVISDVYRDGTGAIVAQDAPGSIVDLSTKRADITVSWTQPQSSSIYSTLYLTRIQNNSSADTTKLEFDAGTYTNLAAFQDGSNDGTIRLSNNNKAKWCSPVFTKDINGNDVSIDLPDGPPVAVAATASAVTNAIPNDIFVATAPNTSSSIKMAYVNVTADTATPTASLKGKFTMDAAQFSVGYSPQSGTGLDNNFKTNDVTYYKSASGKLYVLLSTNLPNKEVVAIQVDDNNASNDGTTSGEYQDPVNKIYKYWTFFNTRIYSTNTASQPNQDAAPYGYGANTIAVLNDRAYITSGGYLYVIRLDNIDSKTTSSGLDMYGCRLELSGNDCNASTSRIKKYGAGATGTSYGTETSSLPGCTDGGNIEIYADNGIHPITTGGRTYVYVAVGGNADNEFEIIDVTTPPSSGTSLTGSSCGRASSTNASWSRTNNTLDFNDASGTQEAANSIFAKSDGSRAYISSNGGIDAGGPSGNPDGVPDSKQFYILDTTDKNTPRFLSTGPGPEYQATSGYYYGTSPQDDLFPRRSMTVLNGERAVLVGSDGFVDSDDAQEYQVLNIDTETSPSYCSGLNYDQGFNDLTYVSEKDYETYIYMIANTNLNELKIIEGGPDDAIYVPSGSYESPIFDTASVDGSTNLRAFNRLLANINQPYGTSVEFQLAIAPAYGGTCNHTNYDYVGPGGTNDPTDIYSTTSTGILEYSSPIPLLSVGNYQNPGRCFRYKIYMKTADQTITPYLYDISWNFSY